MVLLGNTFRIEITRQHHNHHELTRIKTGFADVYESQFMGRIRWSRSEWKYKNSNEYPGKMNENSSVQKKKDQWSTQNDQYEAESLAQRAMIRQTFIAEFWIATLRNEAQ